MFLKADLVSYSCWFPGASLTENSSGKQMMFWRITTRASPQELPEDELLIRQRQRWQAKPPEARPGVLVKAKRSPEYQWHLKSENLHCTKTPWKYFFMVETWECSLLALPSHRSSDAPWSLWCPEMDHKEGLGSEAQ